MPVSGQLCEAGCWKKHPCAPASCGLSACRHWLVGPSCPAASRSWAFLAVGLPGVARTSTGFPRSAQPEIRPARVPPVPRGHGVPTAGLCSPAAVAASQRQALPPALRPIARGLRHEASTRVSLALTRPVFPLPVAPVWGGRPLASPPMLRTPPLPATHVRVGTDHEHFSGAHRRLHPVPPIGDITRAVRLRVANRIVGHPLVSCLCRAMNVVSSVEPVGKNRSLHLAATMSSS